MKDSFFKKILTFFIFGTLFLFTMSAQSVRDIVVSYNKSYTDHVSLASDSRDMDLMVKFVFDEDKNQLTVSLISYRYLFVFRSDVRFGNVIHHNHLEPEDLPYVAEFPEKSRFILSKQFKNSLPKPQKDYIFTKWIEYNGLKPVPSKFKMVNDYIEQTFDITNNSKNVNIKLGDIYVMDKTPEKKYPDSYTIVAGKNLNTEYKITILRNPCFGLESELELAENALKAVEKAYQNFSTAYESGIVSSEGALKTFNDLKQVLTMQFQPKYSDSPCAELKGKWDKYDSYVDSISSVNCVLKSKDEGTSGGGNINFDPAEITTLARQIDKNISRWLISKDNVEKQDLIKECEDIINEANAMIGKSNGSTPEQKKAVNVFRQAEAYFRNTCGKRK